jgi:hypothetical protein
LRYHGLAAFRQAILENLRQASLLAELVEAEPSLELLVAGRAERRLRPLDERGRGCAQRPRTRLRSTTATKRSSAA